jgi:hypothetical protein
MTAITPANGHDPCSRNESHEVRRRVAHPNLGIRESAPSGMAVTGGTVSRIAWGARLAGASKPNAAPANRSARTTWVNPSTVAAKRPSVRSGPGSVGGRVCGDEPPLVGVVTLPMLRMTMHAARQKSPF